MQLFQFVSKMKILNILHQKYMNIFGNTMCACMLSHSTMCVLSPFSRVWLFATLLILACQVLLSMDFSIHGILHARILEWVAIPFSRGSSRPTDWTHISYISCVGPQVLYHTNVYVWEDMDPYVSVVSLGIMTAGERIRGNFFSLLWS